MAKQTFTTGQVLTAAQMTSLQQTAMLGGAASAKTASYTLVAADAGTAISMSNASATTITVNTALFAAGDTVQITNLGAGVCTITAGTATVDTSASLALAQYESGTLNFTSTSAAIFIKGDVASTGGSMTLLSTTTLSGAITTISGISGSYTNLFIYIYEMTNATGTGSFRIAPNGTTNITNSQGTTSTTAVAGTASNYLFALGADNASVRPLFTSNLNAVSLTIHNYASTVAYKTFSASSTLLNGSSVQTGSFCSGGIQTTSAITSLAFSNAGGNMSTGQVLIYGVK